MADRRKDDDSDDSCGLRVVDTSESLTLDELKELKKLAGLSKATRLILGFIFALVGLTGLPMIIDFVTKGHN